ncbi:MAG TPA: CocE/NonD family hydrolase [Actinomycetota bacterium]|nr:CocE/NonD family hydrolase [Actinomycetota bacterium]
MSRIVRVLTVLTLAAMLLPAYLAAPAAANHDNLPGCAKKRITGYIPVAQGTLDATELHYQVFLPKDEIAGPGPYPAVMDYSGYQPGLHIWDGLDDHFTCEGYAVVGLSIRGTGCSGGDFDYFEPRQAEDGREAIEFLTKQPWSNGRLAMVGKSYPGITQLFVAGQPLERGGEVDTPEGLVAIVPGHVFGDLYRDVPYPGGIMNVTFAAGWSAGRIYEPFQAPLEDQFNRGEVDPKCTAHTAQHVANPPQNPFVKALYNHYDGDLFYERSPWYWAHNIEVPTFLIESWQDEQVGSRATNLVERFRPGLEWRGLFTNGDHGEYYGPHVLPYIDEFLRFYLAREIPQSYQGGTVTEFVPHHDDPKHLDKDVAKDKGKYVARPETFAEALARYESSDPLRINWETGAKGGRNPAWSETYSQWPPAIQTPWRLHLDSEGRMSATPDPDGGEVSYDYSPATGTQARGGHELTDDAPDELTPSWSETPPPGTFALFETGALETDKLMAGSGSVDLLVSSTAPDTDFQVTLTEVRPDGKEVFVQQGWLRASHRKEDASLTTATRPYQTHVATDSQPLIPGETAELSIEIFPFAHAFRAGSKIRLYVEAPHVKPDLWGFALLPVPAANTIHVEGSSVALPLLEGATAQTGYPGCSLRNQPCRDVFQP